MVHLEEKSLSGIDSINPAAHLKTRREVLKLGAEVVAVGLSIHALNWLEKFGVKIGAESSERLSGMAYYADKSYTNVESFEGGNLYQEEKGIISPVASSWTHSVATMATLEMNTAFSGKYIEDVRKRFRGSMYYKKVQNVDWMHHSTVNDGREQTSDVYNDDNLWVALNNIEAYEVEKDSLLRQNHIQESYDIFVGLMESYISGGMPWMQQPNDLDNRHHNTVSTGPLIVLYYKLSSVLKDKNWDKKYYPKIEEMYRWLYNEMYDNKLNLFNDRVENDGKVVDIKYAYNQGMMIWVELLMSENPRYNTPRLSKDHFDQATRIVKESMNFFSLSKLKNEDKQFIYIYFKNLLRYTDSADAVQKKVIYEYILRYANTVLIPYVSTNKTGNNLLMEEAAITGIFSLVESRVPKPHELSIVMKD